MKKIIWLNPGVVALLLMLSISTAMAGPAMILGSSSGQVGSATPVDVTISYEGDGTVVGLQAEFTYDSTNLTVDISSCGAALGSGFYTCSNPTPGVVRIVGTDGQLQPIPSGSLGKLMFDISTAPADVYAIAVQNEKYGDASQTDVPASGTIDGSVTVSLGPQPDWSSTPTSAAGLDFGSKTTETGLYPLDLVVTNTGAAGSTLTGSCDVSGSAVFSIPGDNTLGAGLAMGASSSITAVCNTTGAAVMLHTGTMSCTHNGDGTTETSITDYDLSCNVTATPQPSFLGVDNGLSTMDVPEQEDPDATATLTVSNNGETGTTLIGACVYAGDTAITVTNGSFAIAEGTAGVDVLATCSGATEGTYAGTLTCGPADPQTWVAANSPYAVNCTVGPPGDAVYSSAPVPLTVIDMTPVGEPVPEGSTVPDQDLVITNDAPEANDNDLALLNCALTDGTGAISATAATTPLAPAASTTVTFSCDTATAGDYVDTYSCDYDVDGDGQADGTATYTVNCGVRLAASEVTETPVSGTALTMYVPFGGVGQASVAFDEVLDEGEDGTLNNCTLDDDTYFSIVAPASFPQTITSGGSVEVLVEGMGTDDGLPTTAMLTCDYTDSQNSSMQVSWPLDVVVIAAGIPTLSTWGLMLMILTLLGLGGLVIRRKDLG